MPAQTLKSEVFYQIVPAQSKALGKVFFGVVWDADGWRSLIFPEVSKNNVLKRTRARFPNALLGKPSLKVKQEIALVQKYLRGEKANLRLIRLSMSSLPPFHARVYQAARELNSGKTCSYVELATAAGQPLGARAVGQAMAKNPFPLIVPCHRVLASQNKIGGFTAPGGLKSKQKLLDMEGYQAPSPLKFPAGRPEKSLAAKCKKIAKLISTHGEFKKLKAREGNVYSALFRSILFQQLNGRAATTIMNRVKDIFDGKIPTPEKLLATKMGHLRSAGVSANKELAMRDLAQKALDGLIPADDELKKMSDEEIIERLTQVRGIGRWTVEMILIFHLGRPDVWPVDDFAIRTAAGRLFGMHGHPKPKEILRLADHWRPYRSVASWYLWRSLDQE